MTPALRRAVRTPYGTISCDAMARPVIVGDRAMPPWIEVNFPGSDGQPAFYGRVEVVQGVPRWTEIRLSRVPEGREVRQKDLRMIQLDEWLDTFVALISQRVISRTERGHHTAWSSDPKQIEAAVRDVSRMRKRSRRPMTADRLKRVADAYNAQETGGLEAVCGAFNVSRSTAARYVRAAREQGLIAQGGATNA